MKRSFALLLTTLALASGVADAQRRSGGGFGGSRGSGYSAPRYRAPAPVPRYIPPRNNSAGNTYTAPRSTLPTTRTPSTTQRGTTGTVSPANRAAAARVTPTQISQWRGVRLPAGVPRSAITYSAARTGQYAYQLSPGRYFPYPASYYRSRGIGYDILKYALIFTAVTSVADALDGPDVIVGNGVPTGQVLPPQQGPNVWNYAGVGFLAAAAAWFLSGRRRR